MVIEADQWLLCGRGRERWPGAQGNFWVVTEMFRIMIARMVSWVCP